MKLLRKDIISLVNLLVQCLTQTVMDHVHHLLKAVQHLITNLSCSSLETAVYSCGDRVPLVFLRASPAARVGEPWLKGAQLSKC